MSKVTAGDKELTQKQKMLMFLVVLFWLPLIVFGFLNLKLVMDIVERDNYSQLNRATQIQSSSVDDFIKSGFEQINMFAHSKWVAEIINKRKREIVIEKGEISVVSPLYITELVVTDRRGGVLASYNAFQLNANWSKRESLQKALTSKKDQMTINVEDKISPEISFSAPVLDRRNKVIGAVVVNYSISVLQQEVGKHHHLMGSGSYGLILDEEGHVIASTQDYDLSFDLIQNYENDLFKGLSELTNSSKTTGRTPNEESLFAVTQVGKSLWKSVYVQRSLSVGDSFASTIQRAFLILGLVLVLGLFSTVMIFVLTKRLHRRERELKKANDEIMADLMLGNRVQQALQYVPKLPDQLDFRWYQKAAKYVSGDLCFSYFDQGTQMFTFMLIDVNGKGVQAALKAAAFSSIAKSVWTTSENSSTPQNRFEVFVSAADRFIKSTEFNADFLAVVACEYEIHTGRMKLYRLNYTAPFVVDTTTKGQQIPKVSRIQVPNNSVVELNLETDQALMLLGDAFVESSRSEKRIIHAVGEKVKVDQDCDAETLANYILDWHRTQNMQADDQTIMVLKKSA